MACKVTVASVNQSVFPFQPPLKGGKVFGSATFKVTCDDERAKPELRIDEDLSIFSYFLDKEIYSRSPRVLDTAGNRQGFASIEGSSQLGPRSVSVAFNITTGAKGKQTFDVKLKCRCGPRDSWTSVSVDVSITV